jgi:flavodoxin
MNKPLIVYYSWSGNTRRIAEFIQQCTGGDIFEIKPVKAYPAEYQQCTAQAKQEINAGVLPELSGTLPDLTQYDTVYIGTPNWWSTIAPPVAAFLSGYDWNEKTVVPFCTHGGGGLARCFSDMQKAVSQAKFAEGFYTAGSNAGAAKKRVDDFLRKGSF